MNLYKTLIATAAVAMAAGQAHGATEGENIYVYHNNSIVYMTKADNIDRIVKEDGNTTINIYDADGNSLFKTAATGVDRISSKYVAPVADLLDIQFNEDGSATDVSPMHNPIEILGNDGRFNTTYNPIYGCYTANFDHNWGKGDLGANNNYGKVEFLNNKALRRGLESGHTLETIFKARYTPPIENEEAKWFASHEQGGTGLMICKTANGKNKQNEITFLPNVSTNGGSSWKWATSGVVPQPEVYYHVVGVWNKEEGKAYIYVNGELCNTVAAEGDLHFNESKPNSHYMAIGCDAGNPNGQFGGKWELVTSKIYDAPLTQYDVKMMYDHIAGEVEVPVADVLDIQFNEDGTATDVSAMHNEVETVKTDALFTYYNDSFGRYVARFDNSYGSGNASSYYKVDYKDNADFLAALKNGHTFETVVMADYAGEITDAANNVEAKWFTSHEAGGTGMMVCKTNNGKNKTNEWTFLPNVSTNGKSSWKWATSGVVPAKKAYYHLVGVWDQEKGTASIYVNGQLCNTVAAEGDLHLNADKKFWWVCIGGDAGPSGGQLGWKGDVVSARIYDEALSQRQVEVLWGQVKAGVEAATPSMVTDVEFISGLAVKGGSPFTVKGTGFQEGDKVVMQALGSDAEPVELATTVGEGMVTVTLPEALESGLYRLTLNRGGSKQELGIVRFTVVTEMPKGSDVIAHRGYWKAANGCQNSRAAMEAAFDPAMDLYGAETDIWLTTDGHLMVNHDATFSGVTIQDSTYDRCKDLKLSNGEAMPQLSDLLSLLQASTSRCKLIIEIKEHSTVARNQDCAKAAVEAVRAAGLQDKVEYISFSQVACEAVIANDPEAKVAYLRGGIAPATLKEKGYTGIDYHMAEFRDHPEWVEECRTLGMTSNAWTVTSTSDLTDMMNLGVDFVTTDDPARANEVKNAYQSSAAE